ncbi:MAG: ABC transporter permease [Rhodospirillaceae bacterium]
MTTVPASDTAAPATANQTKAAGNVSVISALAGREFTRFIRQRSRVAGSIGQPVMFWLVLGAGLSPSFDGSGVGGISYMEYFYPGILMMMVLFASIFSTITVIEDRDAGFLQGVVTAPVPRITIVLGKILGGTSIALFQAVILLLAAPFLDFPMGLANVPLVLFALILVALGYTGLGFMIAWGMSTTSGFHAIMMLVMMPMWFLSGALFPMEGVNMLLQALMWINPVTHGLELVRIPFYAPFLEVITDGRWLASLAVVLVWVVVALWASARRVGRPDRGAPIA